MKLQFLCIVMIYASEIWAQKTNDDQFPYLPHFQQPGSSVFASDSSLYLPLEPQTAIPYYSIKNNNNLPFQYLPPTGTKAPASFPAQFPMIMSTSLRPTFDTDDDEPLKRQDNQRLITPQSPPQRNKFNNTQRLTNTKEAEKREMRQIPKTVNYGHPIDRIDVKPAHFPTNFAVSSPSPINQTPASKPKIISMHSMGHRSDHGFDLIKAGSIQSGQYIHAPGMYISSSTTEPAIPIIRLSNEMDLDGSFSYEALGADQTHYVQHSRMENMGTDKEEQVVEGSYSYVGDNGQTYTVHYIADSNGFRASGDHLPVPPPMPEIIQRAVQYNLAEEAKRPPHLKSWQEDEKSYETEPEKSQRFPSAPPRNLFTGRTPEAFSYSFSPGNTQNNLAAAASSQTPAKTIDFTKDQTQVKANNGPISPQITFLASQGAHVPSMNTPQQSIARIFTTEKSNMPQLMNYEAVLKDTDQESNKALWRWQYGINANNLDQNGNKNTISRSSGDEIVINFNDMTPEQYTSMIQSQLEPNNENNFKQARYNNQTNEYENLNKTQNAQTQLQTEYQNQMLNNHFQEINENYNEPNTYNYFQNQNAYQHEDIKTKNEDTNNYYSMNEVSPAPATESSINQSQEEQTKQINKHEPALYSQSKIITHHDFIPPSQTVTKSYDYEDTYYESRKIYNVNNDEKFRGINSSPLSVHQSTSLLKNFDNEIKHSTTEHQPVLSSESNIRFIDFVEQDENKFTPVLNKNIEESRIHETTTAATTTTTTQASVEDILENNIFLKNLVRTRKTESASNNNNNIVEEPKIQFHPKINSEPKVEKVPKFIQYQTKMLNDIKGYRKKAADFSDILNFVAQKNIFESSKVRPKNKPLNYGNTLQNNKMIYIPTQQEQPEDDQNNEETNINSFRTLNHQQQDELRGIIKNYKVLQRNNNQIRNEEDRMNQLRRDLSPPPVRMLHSPNLPPLGRAGPSMKSYLPPVFL